jgi:two-component system cell cycle sensor histidine kinase/response regulator CckA
MAIPFDSHEAHNQHGLPFAIRVALASIKLKPSTILVVDDDVGFRRLISLVLTECGCTTLEAANGIEALLTCRCRQSPIDLLISDIVMPHVNGMDLMTRLRRNYPAMKVLLMSGYDQLMTSSSGPVIAREDIHVAPEFMRKPFSMLALSGKVREILES